MSLLGSLLAVDVHALSSLLQMCYPTAVLGLQSANVLNGLGISSQRTINALDGLDGSLCQDFLRSRPQSDVVA